MRITSKVLLAAAALALATLTACGSDADQNAGGSASGSAGGPVAVVTSTNVWGDVVKQVGGDQVTVTSLITDPAADPHSFEPNAQAQLALSKAELVVENGGGYDDFMSTMLQAAKVDASVINAVDVSGKETGQQELNEHVWYDLPTAGKVASQIATDLSTLRPDQAALFQTNLATFNSGIADLTTRVDALKAAHAGADVAITEPVPLYLTEAAGLVNVTPAGFSSAIEEGVDVPPATLSETLALFTDKKVVALVYNEQTSSPETQQVLAAAKDNAIAVVGVTETLPAGQDYLSWMDSNVAALAAALR